MISKISTILAPFTSFCETPLGPRNANARIVLDNKPAGFQLLPIIATSGRHMDGSDSDRYQQEWGQVGQGVFITPKGMIEVRTGVTYLGQESIGAAYVPYIHEMIHALGFVQHCAPCREKSGTDSHCYLGLDIMSENGDSGKGFSIDKKSNEYYGHSNANCQMDLKKSVFMRICC